MLTLPASTLIFLALDRVDGRKGIDSLVALVRSQFGRDPLQGHLFVLSSFSRAVAIVFASCSGTSPLKVKSVQS